MFEPGVSESNTGVSSETLDPMANFLDQNLFRALKASIENDDYDIFKNEDGWPHFLKMVVSIKEDDLDTFTINRDDIFINKELISHTGQGGKFHT